MSILTTQDFTLTTILMIRHADVHNPDNVIYGRLPRFGLSQTGIGQATQLSEYLAKVPVNAIYSSPLLRARQTAAILNRTLHVPSMQITSQIAEVFTSYQGQRNSTLGPKFNWYDSPADAGDETIAAIADRMSRFLDRIRRKHADQIVIGVSHADSIMILRAAKLGLPLEANSLKGRYYPSKCSITQFSFVPGHAEPVVVFRAPVKAAP